jgi:hypothetical protein
MAVKTEGSVGVGKEASAGSRSNKNGAVGSTENENSALSDRKAGSGGDRSKKPRRGQPQGGSGTSKN